VRSVHCWVFLLLILGCADDHASDVVEDGGMRGQDVGAGSGVDTSSFAEIVDSLGSNAAVAVIRDYYEAINRGNYARAYAHWDNNGVASGQSFDQFRSGYSSTTSVDLETGEPGRIEGAAGSRYVIIPVALAATTTDAVTQCFIGTYTLVRRVVTGATALQRRWHIHSADLKRCAPRRSGDQADTIRAVTVPVQRMQSNGACSNARSKSYASSSAGHNRGQLFASCHSLHCCAGLEIRSTTGTPLDLPAHPR
jgi:hypothetical protein